jgi:hypothetical protein
MEDYVLHSQTLILEQYVEETDDDVFMSLRTEHPFEGEVGAEIHEDFLVFGIQYIHIIRRIVSLPKLYLFSEFSKFYFGEFWGRFCGCFSGVS